jgi:acyl-CoA reductase-like NAD-dependent aldehyde dehydrogenase
MLHIPALRLGKPYKSLEKTTLVHHATGEPIAEVSQVNAGLIARDLNKIGLARKELAAISSADLIARCRVAADHFINGTLPVGEGTQTFDEYIRCLSSTTGSPMVFCKRNAGKVEYVLRHMDEILGGLTRGLDLSILDSGHGSQDGRPYCFYAATDSFGAVLPSNSPGVHSLWVPAIALKIPLVLKPGREEPWTPFRLLQSYQKAGIPAAALNFFPTDHAGAGEILRRCGRSMLFGDSSTTDPYKNDHRVELHGPGYSKILIGDDAVDRWESFIDVMVESIAANGGRSCINVSAVWTPKYGREIAAALAERLAKVVARPWDDPQAELAAFSNPEIAERLSAIIDNGLTTPGATDVTEKKRGSSRLVRDGRLGYVLPTIVHCESREHPLANREFLFPYASVIECPQDEILQHIGPSLVVTALTEDDDFARDLLDSPHVERLNLGAIPTTRISWDQPHEGNLFTHLYKQRAFQQTRLVPAHGSLAGVV